jgi:hypothetical protein
MTSFGEISGVVKRMVPMRLPELSDLCQRSRTALRAMEYAYTHTPPSVDARILEWLESDPANTANYGCLDKANLVHELSEYAMRRQSSRLYEKRSLLEREILAGLSVDPRASLALGPDGFKTLLCTLNGAGGGDSTIRSHMVNNGEDLAHCRAVYPSFELIHTQIAQIHQFLARYIDVQPAFAAIVAYASISNLHPFADGNGRVARMLYNALIRSAFPQAFYFPIYEVSALSRMGMVIRLRQADYQASWLPLISLFSNVVWEFSGKITERPTYLNQ